MVQNMNPIAVICRGRPISYKHWENSIPDEARRRLFFDAIPNPDGPSLICSTASQIAAGAGGVNSSKLNQGKYRLRAGLLESYYCFAHGKAIVASNMNEARNNGENNRSSTRLPQYTAVYVGSHNFSKKAWEPT